MIPLKDLTDLSFYRLAVSCKAEIQFCSTFLNQKRQDRQCKYKRNIEAVSHTHSCHAKARNITYSECVFEALVMQRTKRIRYIISSYVVCLVLPYFSNKGTILRGEKLLNMKCGFDRFLQHLYETFLTPRITQRDIINLQSLHVKYPLY